MLTTKGRYAVMAIVDIAMHYDGNPVNLSDIAKRQNIALNYLEQIFLKLKKTGIVSSTRGPGGGYALLDDPRNIKISSIIDAVEEGIKITRCGADKDSCIAEKAKCKTHDLWQGLGNNIRFYLENISIFDVLEGRL